MCTIVSSCIPTSVLCLAFPSFIFASQSERNVRLGTQHTSCERTLAKLWVVMGREVMSLQNVARADRIEVYLRTQAVLPRRHSCTAAHQTTLHGCSRAQT